MPSYLQIENISKSYGPKILFDKIAFNINEGDKIALIAPNGAGKTSLLNILAGKDKSDSGGSVRFLRDIRIFFLEQEYSFSPDKTVAEQLFTDDFEQEILAKRFLTELNIDFTKKMSELSGGEIKRVAIAEMLASNSDFLVMDEPTNHLDLECIEFLENYLKRSRCTLFMVTHDRYFLDRVCNIVMELNRGAVYTYYGDYANYLEKREERIANYNAETERVRNIFRRELEWMRATPCARTGKAKYRKQAFWDIKSRAEQAYIEKHVSMSELGTGSRLGTKIINCKGLSFYIGDRCLINNFTYNFQRYEKVGIVGANGVGKSTFLNLLVDANNDSIERGESIKIGYYRQKGIEFKEDDTVLDIVPDTHLLNRFLFSHDMFNNRISKLSGGERRRLYLLTILMQNPNLLILDEPTNDLDIVTLNILEEYLLDFKGTLIIVTHDRHFMDRLVDHIFVFCGDGEIKDFIGGYTEYRSFIKDYEQQKKVVDEKPKTKVKPKIVANSDVPVRRKLTYKEKKEFEELDLKIPQLSAEKEQIEQLLESGNADYETLTKASLRYAEIKTELDFAELRWLELSEI